MTNRIELRIAERTPFADNHAFGDVGAYERLSGRAHFAVDPQAAAQQDVVDLDKAPVDDSGLVPFAADFMILKPRDMRREQPACVLRLRQSRSQTRATVLQRRAAQQRADHAGARRQRLLHAPRLRGGLARVGGRHAAWRRSHGARRAGGLRQRQADHRAHPRRIYRRCARYHLLSAQRQDRGAFLCHRLARHTRRGADATALSIRHTAADRSRPVALCLRRVRRRR